MTPRRLRRPVFVALEAGSGVAVLLYGLRQLQLAQHAKNTMDHVVFRAFGITAAAAGLSLGIAALWAWRAPSRSLAITQLPIVAFVLWFVLANLGVV